MIEGSFADPGCLAYFGHTRGIIAILGEEQIGSFQDTGVGFFTAMLHDYLSRGLNTDRSV